ncbi:MAG TPA: hypothetical protein VIE16_09010 [Phenylobacterium sp.]|jgi:hypothetical protein
MTETPSTGRSGATRDFLTGAMIAVGFVMIALCGACTLFFTIGGLSDLADNHSRGEFDPRTSLALVSMVGWPPTLVGVLLVWAGYWLRRRSRRRPSAPPPG